MDHRVFRGGVCAFVFAVMGSHAIACAGNVTSDLQEEKPDAAPGSYGEGGAKHDSSPPPTGSLDAGAAPPPNAPGSDAASPPDDPSGNLPPADDAGPFFAPCHANTDCPHFNADAGPDGSVIEICAKNVGDCQGQGTCLIVASCQGVTSPTCGCDGVTYPGPCAANRAGVSIEDFNACGDEAPDSGR